MASYEENTHVCRVLAADLGTLTILRELLEEPAFSLLHRLLWAGATEGPPSTGEPLSQVYSQFLSLLYREHTDLGEWIVHALMDNENPYLVQKAAGRQVSPILETALMRDLDILSRLSVLDSKTLRSALSLEASGPDWTWGRVDPAASYLDMLASQPRGGYGLWARGHAFTLHGDGSPGGFSILPVGYPDLKDLSHMYGYEAQKSLIRRNIEALLQGEAWQNMLLYGDAGTGKSSTIKAFAAAYAHRGLRIIQLEKHQLPLLPSLMERLTAYPLKFILFLDDLTFSSVDDDFTALKTALEGGLLAQGPNVAIYATTNRRHLVQEKPSDRDGDELHVNDGLQETMGLAGRFGLNVVFERPPREDYLRIIQNMAKEKGIEMPSEELVRRGEAFAIRKNGRSPRVARQFIDSILLQALPLPPMRP